MARRYSPSEIRIPWICVLKREFPDLIPLQRISTKQVQACAYRITLFERGVFDHAVSLSLSVLSYERGGGLLPSQVFARGKDSMGRGGKGGTKEKRERGNDSRFLAYHSHYRLSPSILSSIESHLLFLSALLFLSPSLISSLLLFPFSPVHLSPFERVRAIKTTASVFSRSRRTSEQSTDDAGRSILVQKEEREIKEEEKKKDSLMEDQRIKGGISFVKIFKYLAIFHLFY